MGLEVRRTEELVRIIMAGGGLAIDASLRPTDDLVRLALVASKSNATLRLSGLHMRTTDDLIRIALAGSGKVTFE